MDQINFYKTQDPFGCFSNFAAYPIFLNGQEWPTTEHYFQAQKFENEQDREEIRTASSPMMAARMGRDRNRKLRSDWEQVKVEIMTQAVRSKFSQHAELRSILLAQATRCSSSIRPTTIIGATAETAVGKTCWAGSLCRSGESCVARFERETTKDNGGRQAGTSPRCFGMGGGMPAM